MNHIFERFHNAQIRLTSAIALGVHSNKNFSTKIRFSYEVKNDM